ncbi:M35 family metallo-endopeptidase [Chitinimonas sp.]|uniref:M35 family metallo-endopeptidase n=1 Tax=Chitinimonas sp. TaxID=1934313 RepID=UPI0035AF45B9
MHYRNIAIVAAAAILAANAYAHELSVSVVPTRSVASAAQDVEVALQYRNTGRETLYVYKWNLPGKELRDPLFEISRDGKPVRYVGPLYKRRSPTAEDLLEIAPGRSLATVVRLSDVYDMSRSGNYTIRYKMDAQRVLLDKNRKLETELAQLASLNEPLQSADATLFVEGRSNALLEKAQSNLFLNGLLEQAVASSISYEGCSTSRKSSINAAVTAGSNYASDAVNYFAGTATPGTARYKTWFGKYSSSNWSTVKSHYSKIKTTLTSKPLVFDCSCNDSGVFAKVYPDQPYKYYLCPAFWTAPMTGTDSKGGTLVHESSHFTINGGTDDYAYGQDDAKSLAKSNPSQAIQNADNHEYFAENNPSQQ